MVCMQGNYQNQLVVYEGRVCDYINYILRGGVSDINHCTAIQVSTPCFTFIERLYEVNKYITSTFYLKYEYIFYYLNM